MTTAVALQNKDPGVQLAKKLYHRKTGGVKNEVARPRIFRFGYCYKPSLRKGAELAGEAFSKNIYFMCYASAINQVAGRCLLVKIEDDCGVRALQILSKPVAVDSGVIIGHLTSETLQFAVENLVDIEGDALFLKEQEGTIRILKNQEKKSVRKTLRKGRR